MPYRATPEDLAPDWLISRERAGIRTPTEHVTLNTWTVRVDGRDVTDIEIDPADVSGVRDMVADATGQRVSLGRTADDRGILLDLLDTPACGDFPCCGHPVTAKVRFNP